MGISKTSDNIQIKIKMSTSQETPGSSKAQNEDLKHLDVLFTFKIKIETTIGIVGVSKTTDYIQIKVKMPDPSQETPGSSKALN